MMTRLEHLLLVCAMRFLAIRAVINDYSLSFVRTIVHFDIGCTIHQFFMYGLLESVLGANGR